MNRTPEQSGAGRFLLIAVAALAMAVGLWIGSATFREPAPPTGLKATFFPTPRTLAPFSLVDHHGKPFTADALKGHWSYLFFGYTHCPDVCPTTLSVLNSATSEINKKETHHAPLSVYFVSVDPQRDTPEQLARFVPYFNGDFTGVTGTEKDIDAFSRNLGVLHARATETSGGNYLVDHTASIFLLDPDGNLVAISSPPLVPKEIAHDFIAISSYLEDKK